MESLTKVCRSCNTEKSVDEFGIVKANADGRRYACKECYNAIRKTYRSTSPPKLTAQKKRYHERHREKILRNNKEKYVRLTREWKLLREYGMTMADYLAMGEAQGWRCAICNKDAKENPKGKHSPLCVDHCHKTGEVRGLLCNACNSGLGCFRDNVAALRTAAEYLESQTPRAKNDTTQASVNDRQIPIRWEWRDRL